MLRKGLLVKDEWKETVFPPFYWVLKKGKERNGGD